MKITLTLSLLTALAVLPHLHANAQCANSANIYRFTHAGKTYEVVKEAKSWANAAACAVERGGHLVHINDQAEQTAVYNAILAANINKSLTIAPDGGGIGYVWIGANDRTTEGGWVWDGNNDNNGTPFWNGVGSLGFPQVPNSGPVGGAFNNWGGKSTGPVQEPDNAGNQDGAAIGLENWPPGSQPSNAYGVAGEWNDIIITDPLYFVIEGVTTTAIDDAAKETSSLKIYPNPATDHVSITCEGKQQQTISIYNAVGQQILKKPFVSTVQISRDEISHAGLYYFTIAGNDGQIAQSGSFTFTE